jgi:hypothetical protein
MTAAVEREVSNSYFFSFFFDVSSMLIEVSAEGSGLKWGCSRVCFVGHLARAQEIVVAPAPETPSAWALMWAG